MMQSEKYCSRFAVFLYLLTGQAESSTDNGNPDITAQIQAIRRCQLHFTLAALAGFLIVADPFIPPVVTFGGKSFHYLLPNERQS